MLKDSSQSILAIVVSGYPERSWYTLGVELYLASSCNILLFHCILSCAFNDVKLEVIQQLISDVVSTFAAYRTNRH